MEPYHGSSGSITSVRSTSAELRASVATVGTTVLATCNGRLSTSSSKSNASIRIGKKAFYKQLEMPLKQAYTYTSKMMTLNMMKQDAKEGISAFLGKRSPKWKNK